MSGKYLQNGPLSLVFIISSVFGTTVYVPHDSILGAARNPQPSIVLASRPEGLLAKLI